MRSRDSLSSETQRQYVQRANERHLECDSEKGNNSESIPERSLLAPYRLIREQIANLGTNPLEGNAIPYKRGWLSEAFTPSATSLSSFVVEANHRPLDR